MISFSIIIVTFNNTLTIVDCLRSLSQQTLSCFEVILVDNTTGEESRKVLESTKSIFKFPLKILYPDSNLGFPGGNHYGLVHASGKYIALLNPDAIADKNWLEELGKVMEAHPEVGICASKIIASDTDLIDSAGDGYSTSLKGYKRGENETKAKYNNAEYVFGACAGATLYRKRMIEEIGFLDRDFFLIHEDTDFNFRAQLAGWKVFYVPTALVYHKVRSSIGHMSDTAVYYTLRNNELVRFKNVPGNFFLRCFPEFILGLITEFIYFAVKHKHLRQYFKAKKDFLKALPKIKNKRALIMKNKKVSDNYLLSIMTPLWQANFLKIKIVKILND